MINIEYFRNKALYKVNNEMREYVEKYAKQNGILIDTALHHEIITEYRKYITERGK